MMFQGIKNGFLKKNTLNAFAIFFCCMFFSIGLYGQLRFPNGNQLHFISELSGVYEETEIEFYTGSFLTGDYKWLKISDSLVSGWDFMACFNGDCQGGLPDSGNFIQEFGLVDTIGFIRAHVNFEYIEGTSMFTYQVVNNKNWLDRDTLIFRVTYRKPSGIEPEKPMYPNPVWMKRISENKLKIYLTEPDASPIIQIYTIYGQLYHEIKDVRANTIYLDLPAGYFILRYQSRNVSFSERIPLI